VRHSGRDGPRRAPAPGGFWAELTDPEQTALRAGSAGHVYPQGTMICREGDPSKFVLVILDGFAKVYTTTVDGHESMLGVRGPGDIVGEIGTFIHQPRSATVCALDRLHGLVLDGERFRSMLTSNPRIARVLNQVIMARQLESDRRFTLGTSDGERRLAWLLLDLSQRFGVRTPAGETDITLPLSQADLASWIGKSREMVARAFRGWRTAGLVRTGRRHTVLLDPGTLQQIADGNEDARVR